MSSSLKKGGRNHVGPRHPNKRADMIGSGSFEEFHQPYYQRSGLRPVEHIDGAEGAVGISFEYPLFIKRHQVEPCVIWNIHLISKKKIIRTWRYWLQLECLSYHNSRLLPRQRPLGVDITHDGSFQESSPAPFLGFNVKLTAHKKHVAMAIMPGILCHGKSIPPKNGASPKAKTII